MHAGAARASIMRASYSATASRRSGTVGSAVKQKCQVKPHAARMILQSRVVSLVPKDSMVSAMLLCVMDYFPHPDPFPPAKTSMEMAGRQHRERRSWNPGQAAEFHGRKNPETVMDKITLAQLFPCPTSFPTSEAAADERIEELNDTQLAPSLQ